MRKQHHFRPSERGLRAGDVDRLIELSKGLPLRRVPLGPIAQVDSVYWFDGDPPPDHVGISPRDLPYD